MMSTVKMTSTAKTTPTVKTIVATGASSGLGLEAMKQLLEAPQETSYTYTVIVGARNTTSTMAAYAQLKYDNSKHRVIVLPVELSDLRSVRSFAQQALLHIGDERPLDYLFLNAGMSKDSKGPSSHGSKWCDAQVVNHLSQHYLIHLLRDKLVASKARIVVVSSGAIRRGDPAKAETDLLANSGAETFSVYSNSKFTQLLSAHWWRRELAGSCIVVAVSPGLIPNTGIFRHYDQTKVPTMASPDAKTVEEGAQSLLRAFTRNDLPEDSDRIFLTSWGEWWETSDIQNTLDKELQIKWSPSKDEIEKENGL